MQSSDLLRDMSHAEILLTRREAAEQLRVSLSTLERWERVGKLTPTRLSPGVVRYRKADIERLIEGGAA